MTHPFLSDEQLFLIRSLTDAEELLVTEADLDGDTVTVLCVPSPEDNSEDDFMPVVILVDDTVFNRLTPANMDPVPVDMGQSEEESVQDEKDS